MFLSLYASLELCRWTSDRQSYHWLYNKIISRMYIIIILCTVSADHYQHLCDLYRLLFLVKNTTAKRTSATIQRTQINNILSMERLDWQLLFRFQYSKLGFSACAMHSVGFVIYNIWDVTRGGLHALCTMHCTYHIFKVLCADEIMSIVSAYCLRCNGIMLL